MKLYLEALKDFFRKYKEAFLQIWNIRHELDSKDYLPHEAQFLPAALSLQETPVSPLPLVIMRVIITFAAIALLWAILGKVDVVAVAHGKVVPNDRTKVIQPVDTAVVKAIYVSDGQSVKSGQVLVELDATMTEADVKRLKNTYAVAVLQMERSKAFLQGLEANEPPILKSTPDIDQSLEDEAVTQLISQFQEFKTKLTQMNAEIEKQKAELVSIEEQVKQYEKTLPIVKEREKAMQSLAAKHFVSKHDLLEKQQQRIEQESALAVSKSRVNEIKAALLEVETKRDSFIAETKRHELDVLNEASEKVESLANELEKAKQQDRLMTLKSPVDGTVQQLEIHTVGGVVTEAQPLMVIVPQDEGVEVEAFIENKDIGFVNVGQDAQVKVETFQYTKYGTIPGVVSFVSHDAIEDEKLGLIYATRVKLNQNSLKVEGKEVALSPGMGVGVEIKISKRRVIEYFLTPFMEHVHEGLSER